MRPVQAIGRLEIGDERTEEALAMKGVSASALLPLRVSLGFCERNVGMGRVRGNRKESYPYRSTAGASELGAEVLSQPD